MAHDSTGGEEQTGGLDSASGSAPPAGETSPLPGAGAGAGTPAVTGARPTEQAAEEPPAKAHPQRDGWLTARYVIFGAIILYLVLFVVSNTEDVEVNFLVASATAPLVFALALVGVLGFLLGVVLMTIRHRHRRH